MGKNRQSQSYNHGRRGVMREFIANTLALIIISSAIAFWLGLFCFSIILNDCAKQHNVYACEYVAVPKKEGE